MNPDRFARIRAALVRRQPDLAVVMDGVHKSHNFSAILRNCDAAGVLEAHVVPPNRRLNVYKGSSGGTKKWVTVTRHEDIASALGQVRQQGFTIVAAHPSPESTDYRKVDFTRPTAIMMGAELHGVSPAGLELADEHVSLPMMGMVHSLNVSVATSLLLFEALRQRQDAGMYEVSRLDPAAFEKKLFEWAYPTLAAARRKNGRPYHKLTDTGEIIRDD
jgi:tRNA (guanosine-2'-O-)-methyltransferase